jgi:hypothetical protein
MRELEQEVQALCVKWVIDAVSFVDRIRDNPLIAGSLS